MRKKRQYHRRLLVDGSTITFNARRVARAGHYVYTPYTCKVVVFDELPFLRTDAGRVWFRPVLSGDHYEYRRVIKPGEVGRLELEYKRKLSRDYARNKKMQTQAG